MKLFLKYFIILFILNISFFDVNAQECGLILFGTIKDRADGSSMPGATIRLIDQNQVTISEGDGHFHFYKLCPGYYNIEVSYIGYVSKKLSIDLTKNSEVNFMLESANSQLNAVKVVASKIEDTPLQTISVLKERELQLSRGESLGEALKRIPGLNSIQTGPSVSKPAIHGMHSNRVLIYNSGVRLEAQQWGSEHAPEIDPFIANEIKVIKGAASVQYGSDALGGVILVEPSPLSYNNKLSGEINLAGSSNNRQGVFSGRLDGATKNNHFAWRIQGTVKGAGNAKTADYILDNTGFNEFNGSLTFGYLKGNFSSEVFASTFNTKLGIFSGSSIGSTTDLEAAIARSRPLITGERSYTIGRPYQQVNHQTLKVKSAYQINEFGKLNFQYSYQKNLREEYDQVREANKDSYQLQFELNTQNLDIFLEHKPLGNFTGRFGVNGMFQQNFYDGSYLIPFFDSYSTGTYFIEKWAKNKFEIEAGARFDYRYMQARLRENPVDNSSNVITPEFNFNQLSGTLGAGYLLADGLKINATLAKAWRPPAISELFIQGIVQANAAYIVGDRNLKEESSLNFSTGITKTQGKLTADASVYYNLIDDYIYLRPTRDLQLTTRGAYRKLEYVQVDARFYGADALLACQFNKTLGGSLKYSGVRASNVANNQFLELIPPDRIAGILSLKLPDTKKIKSTMVDFITQHVATQNLFNPEQEILDPPAAYTLFNTDLTTNILWGKRDLGLSLSAQNLFNKSYRDYLNNFRYFNDDLGRNITFRMRIPL